MNKSIFSLLPIYSTEMYPHLTRLKEGVFFMHITDNLPIVQ